MPHTPAALLMLPVWPTAVSSASKAGSAVGVPAASRKTQSGRISTFSICKPFPIASEFCGC